MTFTAYETSVASGRPIELYEFGYQGGTFRYTSADRDVEFGARTYISIPGLSRSAIEDTGEVSKNSLTLTAPSEFEVSRLFEVYPPSDVVDVTLYRLHRDAPTDARVLWLGRVLNVKWGVGNSEIRCESLYSQIRTPGLRRIYSRNCPHALYGAECRVSQLIFAFEITLDAVPTTEFEIRSSEFGTYPSGYFSGGKIVFEAGGGIFERRGVRDHTGDVVIMTHPISLITPTSTVLAYPGCDRTLDTCDTRFSNRVNFGGFPYVPRKNPFGQNSVF